MVSAECPQNQYRKNQDTNFWHSEKSKKKTGHIQLQINGKPIQQVPSYRYLGMTLDSSLAYKPHLAIVVRNVSHKIYLLSRVKKFMSNRSALLVYKTIVAGTHHTVCTAAATPGKQQWGQCERRADRSGARRIQHVCKCNVDPVKSDLTKLLCFS